MEGPENVEWHGGGGGDGRRGKMNFEGSESKKGKEGNCIKNGAKGLKIASF